MHRRRKWRKRQKHNFAHKIKRSGKKKEYDEEKKKIARGNGVSLTFGLCEKIIYLFVQEWMCQACRLRSMVSVHGILHVFICFGWRKKKKKKKNRFWEKSSSDFHAHTCTYGVAGDRGGEGVSKTTHTPIEGTFFVDVTHIHTMHDSSMLNAGISDDVQLYIAHIPFRLLSAAKLQPVRSMLAETLMNDRM